MTAPPQIFKNRTDALAYILNEGGAVSVGKFYQDCKKFNLVQPDKTVLLCDLVAYMRRELKVGPAGTGQSLGAEEHDRQTRDAELRKLKADAHKAEMMTAAMERELDAKWVLRENADEETCVWVSRLRDATTYHLGKNLLALIHACGGETGRLAEVQAIVDAALAAAANEIADSGEITVEIGEE